MKHISVLLKETIDLLDVKENGFYIDGTLGRGGHSLEILSRLKDGKLYCFDLDETAIKESKIRLNDSRVTYIHDNFANFDKYIEENSLDGIILDLGVSSPQFDEAERGFSYRNDARLDMRMDLNQELSAYEIVNSYEEKDLLKILKDYGEEPFANRIVKEIVKVRQLKPIETTFELVEIIKKAYPKKALMTKGHPAKQTFQALRIATNHELDSIEIFLNKFTKYLKVNGRLVIISFHSLEDRLVKRKFSELCKDLSDKKILMRPEDIKEPPFMLLNRKVIIASDDELNINPRAKSAKLRGIEKRG